MNVFLLIINFGMMILLTKEGYASSAAASSDVDLRGVANVLSNLEENRKPVAKFLSDAVQGNTEEEDEEEAEEESSAETDPTFLSSKGWGMPMYYPRPRTRTIVRNIHHHPPKKCLSPLNTVLLKGGKKVSLENLQIGDEVQTWLNGKIEYSRFIALSHSDDSSYATYKRVTVESEAWVELTDDHLIFTENTPNNGLQAKHLKIGDSIWSKSPETGLMRLENITRIEEVVRKGYYAPITYAGTLLAGDVLVSSYSTDSSDGSVWLTSHQALHYLAAPVRLMDYLNVGKAFRSDGSVDNIFNTIVGAMEFLCLNK